MACPQAGVQRTASLAAYGTRAEMGPGRHSGEGTTPPAGGPAAGFHSRTVPSSPPVASSVPSGLNATPYTPCWALAWGGAPTARPVAGFHSRTVPPGARMPQAPPSACASQELALLRAAEEAAAWCGPVRATTTPTSNATTASPATAHTHRGGRGQPPNSITSCDVTSYLAPIVSAGIRRRALLRWSIADDRRLVW
jgi:hypothetical protein